MSNWEGINEFVAVCDTESFTQAAKRLGVSTAQVSRQITALEARLASKLFYRTTRKVSVTEVGRVYYLHCRQVLDSLDQAERAVTNLHATPRGHLKLTAPITYGERTIAPLVNDFIALYPELDVQLLLSNQTLDLVDEGFDLGIRLGNLENSSMMAKRLSSRKRYVCASPDYLSKHGTAHSLSELEQHNCLLGTMDYWQFQDNGKRRNIRVKGNLRCNSGQALTDAALKGLGIVQLPDYYVLPHIERGELTSILDNHLDSDGIWALYPHNRHLSPKVRMLVDYLSEKLNTVNKPLA